MHIMYDCAMKVLAPFKKHDGGTVVEVGSRDGHDAKAMADVLRAGRIITVEANPESAEGIRQAYPEFENYCLAIGDRVGDVDFYAVDKQHGPAHVGRSSTLYRDIYDYEARRIQVSMVTMDEFVDTAGVRDIECMKIDVEGATYQVLTGFTKLRMTRLLHIEAEHLPYWPGQHLYDDVADHLTSAGYTQMYFAYVDKGQSDSVWLRDD